MVSVKKEQFFQICDISWAGGTGMLVNKTHHKKEVRNKGSFRVWLCKWAVSSMAMNQRHNDGHGRHTKRSINGPFLQYKSLPATPGIAEESLPSVAARPAMIIATGAALRLSPGVSGGRSHIGNQSCPYGKQSMALFTRKDLFIMAVASCFWSWDFCTCEGKQPQISRKEMSSKFLSPIKSTMSCPL